MSDENEFRKEFSKKTIFRKASSLDLSYVPPKLLCRGDVVKTLIHNYKTIVDEGEQPSVNCLILGRGGIGKTVTAKYFGRNLKKIALENDIKLFVEYFDCINFRSKSKIIRELLGKFTHGSGRGYSDDESIKAILTKLVREEGYILLIIDEVHVLNSDEILALLNIAESYGHQNAKLSILLISRLNDWMTIETERILSRLNEKIRLKPYNFEEAKEILSYRSDLAFNESVEEDILSMVAQIVTEHKNIRHGIEILRRSGSYADKEGLDIITADIIRASSNDVYPTFRGDVIDKLSDQELLALLGIAKLLINSGDSYALVEDAFSEYIATCEEYSVEPHVKMSFRKYTRTLSQLKIISSKTVRIENAQRGRHLKITLLDIPVPKLAELLKDMFEKKFKS